ncbi:tetratricopeptide repeat protein [Aliikangiella marina]|uniref:Tetratricopeptide repeat protein n=1 Tax=Aliikangiella marina TaxID=1712262 RepID=A0A545THA5_9GAMM|nr:tetratricopeptide repeat protein [Aliikangiella marina]TQV76531.1 tetratricopeptide repeat protein [Aliikangiella marina]
MSIWEELKTRKIFKAATIYAAVAWGIIQIADILFPVVGVDDWVMSSMVLLAFSGFPLALIAGWMLDLRLEKRRALETEGAERMSFGSRIAEIAVISLFGIGAATLYYNSASEPVQASITPITTDVDKILNPVTDQKTIAVLPFANFSDSTQDEFFADGLSEELLNVLARNKKLRVAARTSAFQYKNTNINVKTIASELGVQYILEGSVRRSGDLIRVTAQLIKADEDVHVFSRSWDRNINNVFEVQDEISQSVLEELKVSLLGETKTEETEIGTKDIAAFAEYSRGLSALRNRTKADFEIAIASFKKALELAQPLIKEALNLNPKLASAHAVKGLMHWQLADGSEEAPKELANAKKHLTMAIDLNPSIAEAYMWYGSILQNEGKFADGAKFRAKAFEIDPQAAVVGYNRAKDLVQFGNYKEAMDVFNTVVRNNPNYPNAYDIAGDVSYRVGQLDQAYGMYSRMAQLGDDNMGWLVNSTRIYIPIGKYDLAQQNYDRLQETVEKKYASKLDWLQAQIWLASGDEQSFIDWTQKIAEDTRDWGHLLWRGIAWYKQNKLDYAEDDFLKALEVIKQETPERKDSETVHINLLLANIYKTKGDKLKSESHIDVANSQIAQLKSEGFGNQELRYFEAAIAALNGQEEQAFTLLRQSIQEGFVNYWWIDSDPSFDTVRKNPLFITIKDEFNIRMQLMRNSIESQYQELVAAEV